MAAPPSGQRRQQTVVYKSDAWDEKDKAAWYVELMSVAVQGFEDLRQPTPNKNRAAAAP